MKKLSSITTIFALVLASALGLAACGGGGSAPAADPVANNNSGGTGTTTSTVGGTTTVSNSTGSNTLTVTPTVVAGTVNLVNHQFSFGALATSTISEFSGYDANNAARTYEVNGVNTTILNSGCGSSDAASALICNTPNSLNSTSTAVATFANAFTKWTISAAGDVGVLVIDAKTPIAFSEARVFQAFDFGDIAAKSSHIRLSVHSSTATTAPQYTDAGWTVVSPGGFASVGAGTSTFVGSVPNVTITIAAPTVLSLGANTSRYIRVEARNDIANPGAGKKIALGKLKFF